MSGQFQQIRNQPRSILPSDDELSLQMSPFGDERWDLDAEENRRRKETHRMYVYNCRTKPTQPPPQYQKPPEEPKPAVVESPRKVKEEPAEKLEVPKSESESYPNEKDYFKFEPTKPKSISELSFETPSPPNLYPVLKFPEKPNIKGRMYKVTESTSFTPPVPGVSPPDDLHELPPKTQFSVYKDIKFDNKVFHYGVHVPFWEFSRNNATL